MQVARCSVRSTRQAKSLTSERRHTPVLPCFCVPKVLQRRCAAPQLLGASTSPDVHSLVRASTSAALGPAPRASARSSPRRRAGRYMVSRAGRFGANTVPTAAAGFCIGSPRGGHAAAVPARLRRPSPPPPLCARRSPTDPSYVRPNRRFFVIVSRVRVECVSSCVQIASYTPPTQPSQPKGLGWARRAAAGAAKS